MVQLLLFCVSDKIIGPRGENLIPTFLRDICIHPVVFWWNNFLHYGPLQTSQKLICLTNKYFILLQSRAIKTCCRSTLSGKDKVPLAANILANTIFVKYLKGISSESMNMVIPREYMKTNINCCKFRFWQSSK